MKSDKKPIIGFICVMLCCILVIGITIGLLSSVNNTVASSPTADTTDSVKDTTEEPLVIEPELEWGYKFTVVNGGRVCGGLKRWLCRMAYKSDKKTFDADNVKLTLSYGILGSTEIDEYIIEVERIMGRDVTWFEIYFADEAGNNIHTARRVDESFIREKYRVVYKNGEKITSFIMSLIITKK